MTLFSSTVQVAGDILLLKSKGLIGNIIIKSQKLLCNKPVNYTHVALLVKPNLFIHSTAKGVGYTDFEGIALHSNYFSNWRVIRNKKVGYSSDLKLRLIQTANYHFKKKYNYFLSLKLTSKSNIFRNHLIDKTAFCSEFVANVYESLGVKLIDKPVSHIFPCHFEDIGEGWEDVTDIYKNSQAFHKKILNFLYKFRQENKKDYREIISYYKFPSPEYTYKFFASIKEGTSLINDVIRDVRSERAQTQLSYIYVLIQVYIPADGDVDDVSVFVKVLKKLQEKYGIEKLAKLWD